MYKYAILWADDEIELLKPHILFLEQKGYHLTEVNSGADVLELIEDQHFDIIFLDENMPGLSGLETLSKIKSVKPNVPVIMITKSGEEDVMEEAIGAQIADYLVKPINPNQILLAIKKILDNQRIVSEKINQGYQKEFQDLTMDVLDANNHEDWMEVYSRLVHWEMRIEATEDKSMEEVLKTQKVEANHNFSNFIIKNYEKWIAHPDENTPILSHQLLRKKVFPMLGKDPTVLILIDNLRYDQWKTIEPDVARLFPTIDTTLYYSILPTATAYARNAIFSGLLPVDMMCKHPNLWVGEDQETGKNNNEAAFLKYNLERNNINSKFSYYKILKTEEGKFLKENALNLINNPLSVCVFNFVDMLSHARTDVQMIRELTPNESAYRSLTKTWFNHSSLYDILKILSGQAVNVLITSDHGTVNVNKPCKIIGDKQTNTNLRYKVGHNLNFKEKDIFFHRNPEKIGLPKTRLTSTYVFTKNDSFFVYPNNYNHYIKLYRDTLQHGGISLEEILVPFVKLNTR